MARPEQLDGLVDEDALARAREKRRKVDTCVSEKVSITKRMYDALDTCIKNIGKHKKKHFFFFFFISLFSFHVVDENCGHE